LKLSLRIPLVVLLGIALAVTTLSAGVFPYKIHEETLENGLKVLLIPMESEGLVSYWTVVRTGSRDEYEPGHSGFAHFFEHMMFRGTEKFPQDVYNEITTKIGADTNAYTTDDLTAYHLSISAEDLNQVMEIESDRFQNLSYPKPAFQTEAGAVYGEYRKNRMNPFFAVYEAIHNTAFDKHTYGHTTMGYEADIKAMPEMFDYSLTFFSRYYRPENCVLVITGDIDPESTMESVRGFYGAWEPGYVEPKIEMEPVQTKEKTVSVAYEGRSLPIVWIGYKSSAFAPGDKEWVSRFLLSSLAFGETSDIYKDLVLEKQWVEFVAADQDMNRDPGLFSVYTRVKSPERVGDVKTEIDATLQQFRETAVETARLDALKSRLKYDFLMSLDTPDHVASSLARIIAVTGGLDAIDQMYETIETITPEDVRAAAENLFIDERRTVATLEGGQ
jgi:zinc protease